MSYNGLEYTVTNEIDESGNIIVQVDRSNYDDIDTNEDVYTYDWRAGDQYLGEHIRSMAQQALAKPIYLNHPCTDEVYVIQGWGTMAELQKLADGDFVIILEPADETPKESPRRSIDKPAWDAMDTVYRLRRHYRSCGKTDEQRIEALIADEVGLGGMKRDEVIDSLALGAAMLAEGYRLHETRRSTTPSTCDIPDKAIAWRTVIRGYIAMSEARAAQYIFRMTF